MRLQRSAAVLSSYREVVVQDFLRVKLARIEAWASWFMFEKGGETVLNFEVTQDKERTAMVLMSSEFYFLTLSTFIPWQL